MPLPSGHKIVASKKIKDKLFYVVLKPDGKTYYEEKKVKKKKKK